MPGALLLILALALTVRLYLAFSAGMISRDGATFIWYAQALLNDPVEAMKTHDQHPLYSVLIVGAQGLLQVVGHLRPNAAALSDAVLGWQTAAMGVTLLAGLAVVVGVFTLTRALFDAQTALWAAALTAGAAEFCQLSADALSDMPHLALYLFSLTCAVLGFRRARTTWWFGTGCLSALAFLCRPEGAEVAVAGAVTLLTVRDWPWRWRFRSLALLCAGALLFAGPYMLVTGRLVRKKPITGFVAVGAVWPQKHWDADFAHGPPVAHAASAAMFGASRSDQVVMLEGVSDLPQPIRASLMIGEKYARSLRVTLLIPAIAYLLMRRRLHATSCGSVPEATIAPRFVQGNAAIHQLLLTIGAVHVVIVYRLLLAFNYWDMLSVRHVLVLAAITLPFSAAGLRLVLGGISGIRRRWAAFLLTLVLIAPTLPWMLERRNVQDVYLRRAGEWIRTQQPQGARVLTTRNMVPFYANGIHVWSPPDSELERILAEARSERPDCLVFDQQRCLKSRPGFFEELEQAARPGETIELVRTVSQENRDKLDAARVYRYRATPAAK